jgi:hypothetical protein
VTAETEALARDVVVSSALGSPSAEEIRLANQADFLYGKEALIMGLILRLMKAPRNLSQTPPRVEAMTRPHLKASPFNRRLLTSVLENRFRASRVVRGLAIYLGISSRRWARPIMNETKPHKIAPVRATDSKGSHVST